MVLLDNSRALLLSSERRAQLLRTAPLPFPARRERDAPLQPNSVRLASAGIKCNVPPPRPPLYRHSPCTSSPPPSSGTTNVSLAQSPTRLASALLDPAEPRDVLPNLPLRPPLRPRLHPAVLRRADLRALRSRQPAVDDMDSVSSVRVVHVDVGQADSTDCHERGSQDDAGGGTGRTAQKGGEEGGRGGPVCVGWQR